MPDEHSIPTGGVSHASERFGNDANAVSESFGNVRKEEGQRFGKLPNASENDTPSFPKASETFGNNPRPVSETTDETLTHPPRRPVHTLTVREAEKLFEQSGTTVTERSILNWCKPNREGVCRLNCGYDRGEYRWYIAPASVERVIDEERKKHQPLPKASLEFSETRDRLSETFGNEPDTVSESFGNVRKEEANRFGKLPNASETSAASAHAAPAAEPLGHDRSQADDEQKKEIESLQKRIVELERNLASETAANHWKDDLITSARDRLDEYRQDYNERMKFFHNQLEKLQTTNDRYVEELVGINRLVGKLEAENRTLRMLPAGRREPRDGYDDNAPRPEESPRDADGSAFAPEAPHDQPDNPPPFHV